MNRDEQEHAVNQAIMFADVSGSSALYKQHGNVLAKQLIDKAVDLMCDITRRNRGTVVKTIGDEVMARFESPDNACEAATAIQRQCQIARREDAGGGVAIRVGIDFGHAILDGNDVFGNTVNDAAYVAHVAQANQIVITQHLVDALSEPLRQHCQEFDRVNLKGDHSSSLIYRFVWESPGQTQQATVVMAAHQSTPRPGTSRLELHYGQQSFVLTGSDLPFVIGRDHHKAHLPIDSTLASRDHCHLVMRRGKFVLIDHSTNGTYVKTPDRPEIYLRREELPLIGEGTIAIGRRAQQAPELTIQYKV